MMTGGFAVPSQTVGMDPEGWQPLISGDLCWNYHDMLVIYGNFRVLFDDFAVVFSYFLGRIR